MSRSKFLTNYPSGPSYSSLVLVQFQNWNLNQVSFIELDGIETKLGMGQGELWNWLGIIS
jgi:hypothetical protein